MEAWIIIILIVSITISYLLKHIFNSIYPSTKQSSNLQPGPVPLPVIGNLLLFRKSFNDLHPVICSLHGKFGPIITLYFGSGPNIFVADRLLAQQALVKEGASFANRPLTFDGSNQNHITTAFYSSKWRLLRRNLAAEILQSSRLKTYSHTRRWAMERLLNCLRLQSRSEPIRVFQHFQFSMFSLLVVMCFGDKLDDKKIREIQDVVERLLSKFSRVSMVYMASIWPRLTKFVFRKLWDETFQVGQQQKALFIPLIKQRIRLKESQDDKFGSSWRSKGY
ncbi:cytochrome P450, family 87, subfamily A, polypeptide 6 [Hibiscus trionum]|uniref:Cytochrome P450, family 87, subfamily A, polypeptide 6 n=1 Tax=Hibiscus trionum TaxID=183268 RepID=A0A9W7IN89_HIBTR|nr:cytochrome P450, family 87, subfamily A, polypeptide 6 [Hibiscus trionum]